MGVYIAPKDTTTMERVVEAVRRKPRGAELLVAGDFNVNIAAPEGDRKVKDIATELATEGLALFDIYHPPPISVNSFWVFSFEVSAISKF